MPIKAIYKNKDFKNWLKYIFIPPITTILRIVTQRKTPEAIIEEKFRQCLLIKEVL